MRHFLFENKDYRINPSFKRKRKEQDSAIALARLIRSFDSHSKRKSTGRRVIASRRTDYRQKCVVKMQYTKSIEAHNKQIKEYLIREGTDIDGGRAKLYGTDMEEYKANMINKNFRIFLSPQSEKIELKDMTEKFIKKLEQQTGFSFYWQAANHYNTAHPHAHILINGKDKNGKEVEIPRDIVKTFMREYARDICTSQIGHRTKEDIAIEKEKELEAQRFTIIDKFINEQCDKSFTINTRLIYTNRERVLIRLENLRKLGMCTYIDGKYKFIPDWEENLRANGRYNTFLKARSELKYTDQLKLRVYTGEIGSIAGKVTKVYRTDNDASDNHAVILETPDGNAFFIPLFKQPIMYDTKGKAKVRENDIVSIETHKNQKGRLTPLIFNINFPEKYKENIRNRYS